MVPLIAGKRTEIAELCRRHRVRRLEVFGSAARAADFDPERSDVDFLVEFEPDNPRAGLEAYFGFKEALETLLRRNVDLVAPSRLRNPYLRRAIDQSRVNVFEA